MPLVDLDDPEELRARWTALAAVAHATGFDRRWYADAEGYHHQDETASVLRMVRLDDGRAVLWGFHTQHSQTAGADLLGGSPDWIGQPEVRQRLEAGELGFVYGAFNGTWARASYPGDPWEPAEDGFAQIGKWITSDEAAADEMVEWVAEWSDYLGGLDQLRPYGLELIRAARGSGVSVEALGAFFDRFGIAPRSPLQPDLEAGVAAAEDFTRNVAGPASFPDDPDTAEVSVVEDVVIGSPDTGRPPEDDEESFVVPPGISPFTGQPIDEAPAAPTYDEPAPEQPGYDQPSFDQRSFEQPSSEQPSYEQPEYEQSGSRAARDDGYGVTGKKQGWLRRRKHDTTPQQEPAQDAQPPHDPGAGTASGAYLSGASLPSSEPPRIGGGVYEGEDFFNSLFADDPAPAGPEEQDWETAEQPAWSEQEPTSEYTPFAEE